MELFLHFPVNLCATTGVAKEREVEGDLFLHDMGQGMPFRAGTFDGAVSISAVQWLCNEDKSWHNAQRRITCFFQSLYSCLARGAKAIIQLYPETPQQMELITSCAMRCGFTGLSAGFGRRYCTRLC